MISLKYCFGAGFSLTLIRFGILFEQEVWPADLLQAEVSLSN